MTGDRDDTIIGARYTLRTAGDVGQELGLVQRESLLQR